MDWFEEMPTSLWVLPAGLEARSGEKHEKNMLEWTSKYGSISTVAYDLGTADGLNEMGLAACVLWLAESEYGERDESIPGLGLAMWVQYYLDNFATVAEAVDDFEEHPFQLVPADVAGRDAMVHLHMADASGDCAVWEVLGGEIVIHRGKQYNVLTNSPPFAEQQENLARYEGFGGDLPLPGSTAAAARFVRAAYYTKQLPPAQTTGMAIAEILSVLRNVAQPFGVPDPLRPNVSPTLWRVVRDHTNVVYFFEPTTRPELVWLDSKNLDFSPGAPAMVLELDGVEDAVGEQSASLRVESPERFAFY